MQHNYKTRFGGATVTIFVPYDCNNCCPFCINKGEYADTTGFSLEAICDSIEQMHKITPDCDFVFTGGEPLADLRSLDTMLDHIPFSHKVYINTTLPVSKQQTEKDVLDFVDRNRYKITCINVSRHLQHYVVESDDRLLQKLVVPFRINCVLYKNYPSEWLPAYLDRFSAIPGASVQFRFDYTATTPENLYRAEDDPILHDLGQIASFTHLDGCRMRCGYHFDYHGMELTYHKTLPYSTIVEEDLLHGKKWEILYDILIKQNGDIHSDWTGVPLDLDAYRKAAYEPYDLKEVPFQIQEDNLHL